MGPWRQLNLTHGQWKSTTTQAKSQCPPFLHQLWLSHSYQVNCCGLWGPFSSAASQESPFFTWAADLATHFWGRGDNFYRVNTARMKNFFSDIFPCYDTSTKCPDTEWLCVCRILIVAVCLEGQKEQRKNFKLISWKENHVTEDEECKCQHYMPIRYKEWESRQAAQKVLLLHFLEGLWGMVWDWVEHGNMK